MYVAPEARGSGCAHQLLDAIADLATRRHGKRLVLDGRVQYSRHPFLPLVRIRGDRSATPHGPRPEHHRDRVRVSACEDAALAHLTCGINSWTGRFRSQASQRPLGLPGWGRVCAQASQWRLGLPGGVVSAHKCRNGGSGCPVGSFLRTSVAMAARVGPGGVVSAQRRRNGRSGWPRRGRFCAQGSQRPAGLAWPKRCQAPSSARVSLQGRISPTRSPPPSTGLLTWASNVS
jgi:hypothetical protein